MRYKINDIIQTTQEFGERIFVIVELKKKTYLAVEEKTGKKYAIADSQIQQKIGESSKKLVENDPVDEVEYCQRQSRLFPEESNKWNLLAKLKKGDIIKVVHRKTIYPAIFISINLKKPLYPLRAKIKGLTFDFRLNAII